MNLLQVNVRDVVGGRFNGYAIRDQLDRAGVSSRHLVWERTVDDPRVGAMFPVPGVRMLNTKLTAWEDELSWQSILQVHSFGLPAHRAFREADVVHYHIIHDKYFSISALPFLSRLKPSLWTWHDPWPMTGHCIYPMECDKWKTGCGGCGHLDRYLPMKEDKTALAIRRKQGVIADSKLEVVLASQWMVEMAKQSPVGRSARLHHVPFGVDLELYRPGDNAAARRRFGIPEGNVVIALRAVHSDFKGIPYFVRALEQMFVNKPISIIALQGANFFNHLLGRYHVVELGWINDDDVIVDMLNAADIFAMPSTAEAFGMMAIEAMACGTPVVCFEGTSLPEVTFAPECGIAVPMRDAYSLSLALEHLVRNDAERQARGRMARSLAEQHYDERLHVARLAALYRDVAQRRGKRVQ